MGFRISFWGYSSNIEPDSGAKSSWDWQAEVKYSFAENIQLTDKLDEGEHGEQWISL